MKAYPELVIGGLRFAIDPLSGIELIERDPLYRAFSSGAAADGGIADREITARDITARDITVTLTLDPAPDLSHLPVLFDTEEAWTAFTDQGDIILRLRSAAGPRDPLWVARLSGEPIARVTVHCGPGLLERRGDAVVLNSPLHYPLDQLLMMFALPAADGLLVHAAGLARGAKGVFCAGVSGAGKTTLMSCRGDHSELLGLSDDRVIVRWIEGVPRLFGTPWAGEGRVAENHHVELAAVMFIHQSRRHELRRIDAREALDQLLATVSILWFDRARMERAMSNCQRLVESLPCYELHFRPDPEALDLLDAVI